MDNADIDGPLENVVDGIRAEIAGLKRQNADLLEKLEGFNCTIANVAAELCPASTPESREAEFDFGGMGARRIIAQRRERIAELERRLTVHGELAGFPYNLPVDVLFPLALGQIADLKRQLAEAQAVILADHDGVLVDAAALAVACAAETIG